LWQACGSLTGILEAHTTALALAQGIVRDQLNAGDIERLDNLHQSLDDAADMALARLHPLNGRERNTRKISKPLLINAKERACRPHLCRSNHHHTLVALDYPRVNYQL